MKKIKQRFKKIDLVLSPAIGGIVIGYEVGRQLRINTIFAERESGTLSLRRGFEIQAQSNVLIVEDVITTGKSALECVKIINMSKANLVGYACIIDRSNETLLIKDKIISQIKLNIKTFTNNEIPIELQKIRPVKPGSRS